MSPLVIRVDGRVLRLDQDRVIRVGRAIELDVAAPSRQEAESRARQMCDKLLANPVTEDYLLDVEER